MSTLYNRILEFIRNSPAVILLIGIIILFNSVGSLFEIGSLVEQIEGEYTVHYWYRIILSMFLSPNYPEISALSIIALLLLGPIPEKVYGPVKLTTIYLLSGTIGGFYFMYISNNEFVHCSLISIIALVGVYIGLYIKRKWIFHSVDLSFVVYMIILFVFLFLHNDHPLELLFVGLILGLVLSLLFRPQPLKKLLKSDEMTDILKSSLVIIVAFFIFFLPKITELAANSDLAMANLNIEAMTLSGDYSVNNIPYTNQENSQENLSPTEQILKSLIDLKPSTKVDISDIDEAWTIVKQVLDDHPEIFYLDLASSSYLDNGQFQFTYLYSEEEILSLKEQVNNKANQILSKIDRKSLSEDQLVKAVHDYLVKNSLYDNNLQDQVPGDSRSIVGTLLNQLAVSEGYAKTTQYLLNKLDIENIYVTGVFKDQEHAWNKVKIYGNWYNVDVTLDVPAPGRKGAVSYRYFLVTDDFLLNHHSWNQQLYPLADNTNYMENLPN